MRRKENGVWGVENALGCLRLPQRPADPLVMKRLPGRRSTLALLGVTLYSFETVKVLQKPHNQIYYL